MKKLLIILSVLILSSCDYNHDNDIIIMYRKELHKASQETCEKAYFEGQKDAINGEFRIKINKDSVFIWVKSPWDDNRKPIYNPTFLDSKK